MNRKLRKIDNGQLLCRRCNTLKPLNLFSKETKNPLGFQYSCKECQANRMRNKIRKIGIPRKTDTLVVGGQKKCSKCKQLKSVNCFGKHTQTLTGLNSQCKDCVNKHNRDMRPRRKIYEKGWSLKYKYGISLDNYNTMKHSQGDKCKICQTPELECISGLCVDHNHVTGEVRGLLCSRCNTALGSLQENIENIKSMLLYLGNHNTNNLIDCGLHNKGDY